jgi:hypothetical protein
MSHTFNGTNVTRQVRKEQERTHVPITKMLMVYNDPTLKPTDRGYKVAKVIEHMGTQNTQDYIMRTLRWASNHGVEVTFRPI